MRAMSGGGGRKLTGKCYGYLERRHSVHERHPGVSSWSQYMCCRRSSAKTITKSEESYSQIQYSPDPFARVMLRI